MKILFLDDNVRSFESFKGWIDTFRPGEVEFTYTDNLVDFDYELYESGNPYDIFVIDLNLEMPPDFQEDQYSAWLEGIGIRQVTELRPGCTALGWDYYDKVMREKPSTKDRLNHVLLKTGYADLLMRKFGKNCCSPATLLNKGDEQYDRILRKFLEK